MLKHFQLIKLENKVHKVQSASPFLIFEFVGEVLSGIKQKTGRDDQRKSSEMAERSQNRPSAIAEEFTQVSQPCFRTLAQLHFHTNPNLFFLWLIKEIPLMINLRIIFCSSIICYLKIALIIFKIWLIPEFTGRIFRQVDHNVPI